MQVGISLDDASQTGQAIDVQATTVKLSCGASVSAGAIVGPQTATGQIVERANPATTTTQFEKSIGIALEAGSTNSVIQVLLSMSNLGAV